MSFIPDVAAVQSRLISSGGFAALGSDVRLMLSNLDGFVDLPGDNPVSEADLSRDGDDLVLVTGPSIAADVPATLLQTAWLIGSSGAVRTAVSPSARYPVVAGNGLAFALEGLRWTLPA